MFANFNQCFRVGIKRCTGVLDGKGLSPHEAHEALKSILLTAKITDLYYCGYKYVTHNKPRATQKGAFKTIRSCPWLQVESRTPLSTRVSVFLLLPYSQIFLKYIMVQFPIPIVNYSSINTCGYPLKTITPTYYRLINERSGSIEKCFFYYFR